MKTFFAICLLMLTSGVALAQGHSQIVLRPGEVIQVLDPRTSQPLVVRCSAGPQNPPAWGDDVGFFTSDRCEQGDSLALLRPGRDCQDLARQVTRRVWGITVAGVCHDTRDADFLVACRRFEAATQSRRGLTFLYRSDNCDSDLVAIVNANTDCASLGQDRVWSIKTENGTCQDIRDLDLVPACNAYK